MDEKQAKEILGDNIKSPEDGLYSLREYIHWNVGDDKATLDGKFTADELEATAWWMRKGNSSVQG